MQTNEWIASGSALVAFVSVIVSGLALFNSFSAKREAKQAGILSHRLVAIEQVRKAMGDILLADHIDSRTTSCLAEALQLSKVIFNGSISGSLENLYGIAFSLEGKPCSERTEQEAKAKEFLNDQIQRTLKIMQSETAIG